VRILVANQQPLHNPSLCLLLSSFWLFAGSHTLSLAYHLSGPLRLATVGDGNHEIAIADGPHDPDSKKSKRPYPVNQTPALVLSLVKETLRCFTLLRCDTRITLRSISILSKPRMEVQIPK
jgi:hypothetical protein